MADPQHLTMLKQDVDSWNAWRQRAGEPPVPGGAGASAATATRIVPCPADLRFADLRDARLAGANLAGCDLSGADLSESDLYGADLQGADLSGANLEAADLSEAQLFEADLTQACLAEALLDGADLGSANLQSCNLEHADLSGTNLRDADLRAARLPSANLGGAELRDARLAGAQLRGTLLVDLDLSRARGLSAVEHLGPSSVGTDTLARTAAALRHDRRQLPEVEALYHGAGVEQYLIEYYRTHCGVAPGLQPCYIVHHPVDGGFASVLHDELQARGVTCWLDPGDRGTPATRTARGRGIKVVLCVTRPALESLWARDQLAFARDHRLDPAHAAGKLRESLMIVDLDGRLVAGWGGAGADCLRELVVADFSGLESERTTLEAEITRVVAGLAREIKDGSPA